MLGVGLGVGVGGTDAASKVAMTPVHATDADSTSANDCAPVALSTSTPADSPVPSPLTVDCCLGSRV
jgi:hypothetical protein